MLKHMLFLILIVGGVYYYWTNRPVTHGPGVVAPEAPVQEKVFNADKLTFKDFDIVPKAKFKLEARVLAIEKYYFDKYSDLTTTDIVFGWGPMSNEKNLESLLVRQNNRSFYWEMAKPPIEKQKMWQHASNMHVIGSNKKIQDQLGSLREGHIVRIKGYLVNAKSPAGWTLKSSLSRDDIGDDSSELVWINSLSIL